MASLGNQSGDARRCVSPGRFARNQASVLQGLLIGGSQEHVCHILSQLGSLRAREVGRAFNPRVSPIWNVINELRMREILTSRLQGHRRRGEEVHFRDGVAVLLRIGATSVASP